MADQSEKKAQFLPFHALNEFMTDEYRLEVIRDVFMNQGQLSEERQNALDRLSKKFVQIPGFRNAIKAPASLKVKPAAQAFQKSPELVAGVLAAWAELKSDLRQGLFDLLKSRNWELLPLDADRTRLPGFFTVWPRGEDFEAIQKAYAECYPDTPASDNDIALMAVWVTGRLPYQFSEAGEVSETGSPASNATSP